MAPIGLNYVNPDSVLARTALEMVQTHAGGMGPHDGMTVCPVCGERLPCTAGLSAAEVVAAAGLAEASGLVAAARQGRGEPDRAPGSPFGLPGTGTPAGPAPTSERPTFDPPTFDPPAFERPAFERPAFERPAFERPTFERSESERSAAVEDTMITAADGLPSERPEPELSEPELPESQLPESEQPESMRPEPERSAFERSALAGSALAGPAASPQPFPSLSPLAAGPNDQRPPGSSPGDDESEHLPTFGRGAVQPRPDGVQQSASHAGAAAAGEGPFTGRFTSGIDEPAAPTSDLTPAEAVGSGPGEVLAQSEPTTVQSPPSPPLSLGADPDGREVGRVATALPEADRPAPDHHHLDRPDPRPAQPSPEQLAPPEPPSKAPEVDPLLLGPPLFAQQNRPLDAPRFTPSARPPEPADPTRSSQPSNGATPHQPAPEATRQPETTGRPGFLSHPSPAEHQDPIQRPGSVQRDPGNTPEPRAEELTAPPRLSRTEQLAETQQFSVEDRPARPAQPGPTRRAPQDPPQPAAGPGDPAEGPATQPPALSRPVTPLRQDAPTGAATGTPTGAATSVPARPADAPVRPTGDPARLAGAPAPLAGAPARPTGDLARPAQPRQSNRPPLEPPQMGQLNRPLDPAATQPRPPATPHHTDAPHAGAPQPDAPSGLNRPQPVDAATPPAAPAGRASVPVAPTAWPPAAPGAPVEDAPSGLPPRPQPAAWTDPDADQDRGAQHG